jgi:hypothetical protein
MESVANQPNQPAPAPEPSQIAPVLEVRSLPELDSPRIILKRRKEVAKAIKQFIKENPSMRLLLEGKKYPYAPVWQFCAACFGVTPMIAQTEELLTDDRKEMGYLAVAHAIDRTGRVISGAAAACMCSEPEWEGKPSFQLRSMAETRGCSKVLSLLFRDVMVMAGLCPTPAEEMGPGEPRRERALTTPCYECGNKVTKKRALATRKKYGKELCLECTKKADDKANGMTKISDPAQVGEFIERAREKKANGAQSIVKSLDHQDASEVVA